jgi:cytochrome subunit of sulfide dehydrogenase
MNIQVGSMKNKTFLKRLIPLAFTGMVLSGAGHADNAHLSCHGCHGPGGVSAGSHIPTISGLNFRYLYSTLQAFRKDRREGTIMGRIAKGYKSTQLQFIALHFGSRPWTGVAQTVDETLARRGAELHVEYCAECHEQNGHFQDKDTPPLAGQAEGYLRFRLEDFRADTGNVRQPALMEERIEKLSDADIAALSAFYASLPPVEANAGEAN